MIILVYEETRVATASNSREREREMMMTMKVCTWTNERTDGMDGSIVGGSLCGADPLALFLLEMRKVGTPSVLVHPSIHPSICSGSKSK
jgi:hypothetical protein